MSRGQRMSTPDGISSEDWSRVHEMGVEIINAPDVESESRCRRRLFEYLNFLEAKYGALPSILATRADFKTDPNEKEERLRRAYALAESSGDARNALYVAHSVAGLCIEDVNSMPEGIRWLECMSRYVVRVDDPGF